MPPCRHGGGERIRGDALLWLALGAMFFVAGAVLFAEVNLHAVGVSLDGSRRWVTRVHPAFVRAVDLQEAGIHRS